MSKPKPQKPNEALLPVRVTPKASHPRIESDGEGGLKVWVSAPPTEGQANEAVISILSKKLGVAKSCIEIATGHTHRNKSVRISGLSREEALARIGS